MQHINLEVFANGAFTAQINRELQKVAENIQDPNTDATAKRRITVNIEFKPNETRDFVTTGVQAKSTLAPALGAVTALNMGRDLKTGEVDAVEIGNQIPGQMNLNEIQEIQASHGTEEQEGIIQNVDPSTGEIYETTARKVIDLRNTREA